MLSVNYDARFVGRSCKDMAQPSTPRDIIRDCYDQLISDLNVAILQPVLLSKNLITQSLKQKIMAKDTDEEQNTVLVDHIMKVATWEKLEAFVQTLQEKGTPPYDKMKKLAQLIKSKIPDDISDDDHIRKSVSLLCKA